MTTTIIGIFGGLLIASVTYLFTQWREREAEWRKEKLLYYKAFVESLSGILEGESTSEGQQAYARACNNLSLLAPQSVIEACDAYRNETSISNPNRTSEKHDKLLAILLLAIRRDIGISPSDNPSTFSPRLWASGVKSGGNTQ